MIVSFVVAVVIFLVAVWFILSKVFPNLLYQLQKLLGIVKPTPIESAIMCSIARCKYGCNSFRVRDLRWEDYDASGKKVIVSCWEKFCTGTTPDVYSEGDKICEKMPIEVILKNPQRISIDHLYDATEGIDTHLAVALGFSSTVNSNPFWFIDALRSAISQLTQSTHIIFIDESCIVAKGDPVDCVALPVVGFPLLPSLNIVITGCYKSLELTEGSYTIRTYNLRKFIVVGPPIYLVEVIKSA